MTAPWSGDEVTDAYGDESPPPRSLRWEALGVCALLACVWWMWASLLFTVPFWLWGPVLSILIIGPGMYVGLTERFSRKETQ